MGNGHNSRSQPENRPRICRGCPPPVRCEDAKPARACGRSGRLRKPQLLGLTETDPPVWPGCPQWTSRAQLSQFWNQSVGCGMPSQDQVIKDVYAREVVMARDRKSVV